MKKTTNALDPPKMFKGEKTKREILRKSVDIASVEGLNGFTIGKLANDLQMSKSGLYSHFGSKEELQMATIGMAREIFIEEVVERSEETVDGLLKLFAMIEMWLSQLQREVFSGGSFFAAAALEFDDRPGRLREFIVEITGNWLKALEKEAKLAVRLGELRKDCDVQLLIFQVYGHVHQANWLFRLHKDKTAFDLARRSVSSTLTAGATKSGKSVLETIVSG